MNFTRRRNRDFYLLDSHVENIFINEYLPAAPGDYVKVYIYGLMYAETGLEMTNKKMSEQLGIPEKEIGEAWDYWESFGAIKKAYQDFNGSVEFTVQFLNLKEEMYGMVTDTSDNFEPQEENVFGNETVKNMLNDIEGELGRGLSSAELANIIGWIEEDGITAEVILFAVKYCVKQGKPSLKYISAVVHSWAESGYNTIDKVEEHLKESDERFYQIKRILKALGFTRNATEAEVKLVDKWFDELGYNMDQILDACNKTSGISSPNFNYVDKVLENWKIKADKRGVSVSSSKAVSQATLNRYYEFLRRKKKSEADKRIEEVYERIPEIREIDENLQSLGSELSKMILRGESSDKSERLKLELENLEEERAVVLTENNYEMDYTNVKYSCSKCNDTGITDEGNRCSCVDERIKEAEIWQKSN